MKIYPVTAAPMVSCQSMDLLRWHCKHKKNTVGDLQIYMAKKIHITVCHQSRSVSLTDIIDFVSGTQHLGSYRMLPVSCASVLSSFILVCMSTHKILIINILS